MSALSHSAAAHSGNLATPGAQAGRHARIKAANDARRTGSTVFEDSLAALAPLLISRQRGRQVLQVLAESLKANSPNFRVNGCYYGLTVAVMTALDEFEQMQSGGAA